MAFVSGQLFTRDELKHPVYGISFKQYSEEYIGLLSAGRCKILLKNLQKENEGKMSGRIMETGALPQEVSCLWNAAELWDFSTTQDGILIMTRA